MQSANAMEEVQRSNMVANISKVVDCSNKITGRRKYAYGFLLGLILNIANVVFNIWLMNTFLKGDFLGLGLKIDSSKELVKIFPRMTMCQWKQIGGGGGLETT